MARLAATAVLVLSLLAVANCRVLEAEPETVVAISDEWNQADPAAPQETDAAEAIPSSPTSTLAEAILRLPSHRRPCRHGLHRHLQWAHDHGHSHHRGAFAGSVVAGDIPAFLPDEPRDAKVEVEAVAEPDPDRRPDTDGEQKPFHGVEEEGDENESVKAWKGELLRRFRGHGLRFHHRHRHHHEQAMPAVEKDEGEHQEQQDKEEDSGNMQLQHVKLFSRHFHHHHHGVEDREEGAERVPVELSSGHFHHHHGDQEQEETSRNHYFQQHHEVHDSDNEVDQVEELAMKLSRAIMRSVVRRGGIGHYHHHSHEEEGGVRKWFKWF